MIAKAITLSSLSAGLALAGMVAWIQANPATPVGRPTEDPNKTKSASFRLEDDQGRLLPRPLVVKPRKVTLRVKTRHLPAPCTDGEYRLVGFEGPPGAPTGFRGVTMRCK
jgi:hypothetical protein